jgi:hypothetical protein
MCKEVVVIQFKVLSMNFPWGSEENHENFSHYSRCPSWDLNWAASEYRLEALHLSQLARYGGTLCNMEHSGIELYQMQKKFLPMYTTVTSLLTIRKSNWQA